MSFRPGDPVDIERDGEWNPGKVVARNPDGGYRVSYDPQEGYEELEDEDVAADQVCARGDAPPPPLPPPPRSPLQPRWVEQTARRWSDSPRPPLEERFEAVLIEAARALRAAASDVAEREAVTAAISSFYDAREAAGEPRRELAIHFFRVDGVGLDGAHAPLGERLDGADAEAIDRWRDLFLEVEPEVR